MLEDIVIIGAGPAGIAAAIQLARNGFNPLILERNRIGGLLANANSVENYPGFPNGLSGEKLINLFEKHIKKWQIRIKYDDVKEIRCETGFFIIKAKDNEYQAKTIIISSGTKPVVFHDFEIPPKLHQQVFYEIYPIRKSRDKKIVMVGAGDAAFDYAINLSKNNEIVILNRGDAEKCLPMLKIIADKIQSIRYFCNTKISGITSDENGQLKINCIGRDGAFLLQADYLVGATGRKPNLDFMPDDLWKNIHIYEAKGLLLLAGDVKNKSFRQLGISVGDGIMAAMKIAEKLRKG
jgi:thioredoxin reductase